MKQEPESGVVELGGERGATAAEQRLEQYSRDILEALAMLGRLREVELAEQRTIRQLAERFGQQVSELAGRMAIMPTRGELEALRLELAGLRHAILETHRQLELHREHTIDQYDRLGTRLERLERSNGNGGVEHELDG